MQDGVSAYVPEASFATPLALACARSIGESLPLLVRLVRQYIEAEPLPAGLTTAQLFVLTLVREGVTTPGNLAARFAVSSPTVTGLLSRLQDKGMVARSPGTRDRRTVQLALTEHGLASLAQAEALVVRRVLGLVTDLTEDQQRGVIEAMGDLRGQLHWDNTPALDGVDERADGFGA